MTRPRQRRRFSRARIAATGAWRTLRARLVLTFSSLDPFAGNADVAPMFVTVRLLTCQAFDRQTAGPFRRLFTYVGFASPKRYRPALPGPGPIRIALYGR